MKPWGVTMCHTASRFDGFFGNARFDDEYQATYGSIAVGSLWDERDRWEPIERRESNWGAGAGLELLFGERNRK
jgi:hypothetical protein